MTKGNAYEERVSRLAVEVVEHKKSEDWVPLDQPGWGRRNRLLGVSGAQHQIDVSIRFQTPDGRKHLWLAESKNWESRASLPPGPVLCFLGRVYDIWQKERNDYCVEAHIFAPKRYGPQAERIAEYYGIGLSFSSADGTHVRVAGTVSTFQRARSAEARAAALPPKVTTTRSKPA